MTTKKESNLLLQLKFIASFPLLLFAFILLNNAFSEDQTDPILAFVCVLFFLLWGSSWFLQSFGLNNRIAVAKIINSIYFKKTIKVLMWLVIIFLVISLLVGAFNFVVGLSATTIIIILLVLILFK